jgi:hypothetical protein
MDSAKKFVVIAIAFLSLPLWGQSVKVEKGTSRIKGDQAEGYSVDLEGTPDEVTTALNKYLKSFAKLKMGVSPMTTAEVVINGVSYKNPLYATVKDKGQGTVAWIGLRESEWADNTDKVKKELERITYDFGVKYYRDKIQVQIDESARALQAVERQQQRLVNESKNLNLKLENNAKEKIQLEKSLEANKLENLTLLTKIDQNKQSQDSVAVAAEQIRKVVEMHKERQNKVN